MKKFIEAVMLTFRSIDKETLKELMLIATPMVISQGAFAVMLFTDRYFMSLISPTHIAASLGGGLASFFCMSFFIGVLSYSNALVAQYYGAGKKGRCTQVMTQSIILSMLFLPFLLLFGWGFGYVFALIGHEEMQVQLEKSYFYTLLYGAIFSLFKTCIASYFSGIGSTKVVMVADTLGVLLNIPLSYVLIFGLFGLPEMGIVGAGVGTIISTVFALGLFALFYWNHQHKIVFKVAESFVIDLGIIKRFLRLGLPSGTEMFLNIAAFNLFVLLFQSYGVAQAAAVAIVFNWDMLSFVPMIGMNIALTSLVGRFIGAGNMDKMNQTIVSGFMLGLIFSGVLAVGFIIFREPMVDIFMTQGPDYQEIHQLAIYMMIGIACYTMADSLLLIAGGVLRGAGDTKWLMKTSVILHWLMLFVQYLVISVFKLGPKVSWIVFVCMIILTAVLYLGRLYGKKWRHPDALSKVLSES